MSLRSILDRLASLLQHLAIPDKAGAGIGRQLKVLRQLETGSRAGLLAKRAEHATRCVEDELIKHLLAARLAGHDDLDVHRNHVDAVLRTSQRAKIARDAKR